MPKKQLSTFEREMKDPSFQEEFEKEYSEFLLSEILLAMMENAGCLIKKTS